MKPNITDNKGMIGLEMKDFLAMVDNIPREILEKMDIEFMLEMDKNTAYLLKEECENVDSELKPIQLYEISDKLWGVFSDSFRAISQMKENGEA